MRARAWRARGSVGARRHPIAGAGAHGEIGAGNDDADVVPATLIGGIGAVADEVLAVEFFAELRDNFFEGALGDEGELPPAGVLGEDFERVGDKDAFDLFKELDKEGDDVTGGATVAAEGGGGVGCHGSTGRNGACAGGETIDGWGIHLFGDGGDEAVDVDGVDDDVVNLGFEESFAEAPFTAFVLGFGNQQEDAAMIGGAAAEEAGGMEDGVDHGAGGAAGIDAFERLGEELAVVGEAIGEFDDAMVELENGSFALLADDEPFKEGTQLFDGGEDGFDGGVGLDGNDKGNGDEADVDADILGFVHVIENEILAFESVDVAVGAVKHGNGGNDFEGVDDDAGTLRNLCAERERERERTEKEIAACAHSCS